MILGLNENLLPDTHLRRINCKVGLQNVVQDLLFSGEASHNLVHLGNNGAEKRGCAEEEKNAEDLQANRGQEKGQRAMSGSATRPKPIVQKRKEIHPFALCGSKNISCGKGLGLIIRNSLESHSATALHTP